MVSFYKAAQVFLILFPKQVLKKVWFLKLVVTNFMGQTQIGFYFKFWPKILQKKLFW
jgi:hypothetical protein